MGLHGLGKYRRREKRRVEGLGCALSLVLLLIAQNNEDKDQIGKLRNIK